jgi:hypothetical protein
MVTVNGMNVSKQSKQKMLPKNASNVGYPDANKLAHLKLVISTVRDRVFGGHLLIPCLAVLDRIKDDWEFVIDPEVRFDFFITADSLEM